LINYRYSLRATLLQLSNHEFILLATMHHIISDGWSIGIFVEELSTFTKFIFRDKLQLYQSYQFNMQTLQYGKDSG